MLLCFVSCTSPWQPHRGCDLVQAEHKGWLHPLGLTVILQPRPPTPPTSFWLALRWLDDPSWGFSQVLTSWKVLRQDERCFEISSAWWVFLTNHKRDKRRCISFYGCFFLSESSERVALPSLSGEYDGLIFLKVTEYRARREQKTLTLTEGEAEVLPLSAAEVQRIECQSLSELQSPKVI